MWKNVKQFKEYEYFNGPLIITLNIPDRKVSIQLVLG